MIKINLKTVGKYENHPTSGSVIAVQQETALPSIFSRYMYGTAIRLKSPYDGIKDVLPPNRITDLRISRLDINSYSVELRWTASKDDYGVSSLISKY